jgi:ABC-type phosphate/phosphonate transport system substrate-binding protein
MIEADTMLVGAVAYGPNVVPIWEGIRDHFRGAPVEMDYILYSNYERLVDALLDGQVEIAWNTNLAYVRIHRLTGGTCRVLAMRDTDIGYRTALVARPGGASGPEAVRGKRLALGSRDSAQAAILPPHFLAAEGLTADEDYEIVRFDTDVGKHGDTGRSELDAMRAVLAGEADLAAIGASSWDVYRKRGDVPEGSLEVVWTTPGYAHCNFTTLADADQDRIDAWTTHLMTMDYENPEQRRVMELEGLTAWVAPELDGYAPLFEAVEEQGIPDRW